MPAIDAKITKPSPDAKIGIWITEKGKYAMVSKLEGLSADSGLQINDIIVSINGSPVASKHQAFGLIKEAESEVIFVVYRSPSFFELVEKEFSQTYNCRQVKPHIVIVDYKHNPDDCTACLFPGCVQQYRYTLTLELATKIRVQDMIAGNFNRAQGNYAARHGNATQLVGVSEMSNLVTQKVSRIESLLVVDQNNLENLVQNNNIPKAEVMEGRGDGVADQLVKLQELREQGILSEQEFETAKKKVLSAKENNDVHNT